VKAFPSIVHVGCSKDGAKKPVGGAGGGVRGGGRLGKV